MKVITTCLLLVNFCKFSLKMSCLEVSFRVIIHWQSEITANTFVVVFLEFVIT